MSSKVQSQKKKKASAPIQVSVPGKKIVVPAASARPVSISKTKRAGLHIPVHLILSLMRRSCGKRRVSGEAPIVLAGALEFLVAEIVEAAARHATALGHKRLAVRHIMLALRGDAELQQLTRDMTTAVAGIAKLRADDVGEQDAAKEKEE